MKKKLKEMFGPLWTGIDGFFRDLGDNLNAWRDRRNERKRQKRALQKEIDDVRDATTAEALKAAAKAKGDLKAGSLATKTAADQVKAEAQKEAAEAQALIDAEKIKEKQKRKAEAKANKKAIADAKAEAKRIKLQAIADMEKAKSEHDVERIKALAEIQTKAQEEELERLRKSGAPVPPAEKKGFKIALTSLAIVISSCTFAGWLIGGIWYNDGVAGALSVLVIFAILALIIALTYKVFFIIIPENHIVCVVIEGKFLHYLCNRDDKHRILEWIKSLPADSPRAKKLAKEFNPDWIKVREDNWILGLFVTVLNLHFKSINPFSSLQQIKILRKKLNPNFKEGDPISEQIVFSKAKNEDGTDNEDVELGEETTDLLRLEFPRAIYIADAELQGNVQIAIVCSVTGICVYDLHEAFFKHRDVSAWVDLMIRQAMLNKLGTLSFDQYGKYDFTAGDNEFNKFMRDENPHNPDAGKLDADGKPLPAENSGISSLGIIVRGASFIADSELEASQQALIDAKVAQEAANAQRITKETLAAGDAAASRLAGEAAADNAAALTRKTGAAEAENIKLQGTAKAGAVKELKLAEAEGAVALNAAIAGDQNTAAVLAAQALANSGITTLVQSAGGATPPVILPTPPPQPPKNPADN